MALQHPGSPSRFHQSLMDAIQQQNSKISMGRHYRMTVITLSEKPWSEQARDLTGASEQHHHNPEATLSFPNHQIDIRAIGRNASNLNTFLEYVHPTLPPSPAGNGTQHVFMNGSKKEKFTRPNEIDEKLKTLTKLN